MTSSEGVPVLYGWNFNIKRKSGFRARRLFVSCSVNVCMLFIIECLHWLRMRRFVTLQSLVQCIGRLWAHVVNVLKKKFNLVFYLNPEP